MGQNDSINIPGFTCLSHPRSVRHLRARRNYGGVCVLISDFLKQCFTFSVVDKAYDGILAVKFDCKLSDFCFLLVAMYLPPEQSSWGRDASGFYSHLLGLVYEYESCDNVILAGDLNSKLGSAQDFIPEIDNVNARTILDVTSNRHGKELLDFLIESKMCVCNGRITPQFDNYTYLHSRGKSVIDYIVLPLDMIDSCTEFKVRTVRDLLNMSENIADEDIELQNIPDHSVLTMKLNVPVQIRHTDSIENGQLRRTNMVQHGNNDDIYFKRFHVKKIPDEFLKNATARASTVQLINKMLQVQCNQNDVDQMYDDFCKLYYDEMKKFLRYRNVFPQSAKRLKRRTKPFWTEQLSDLWKTVCEKEKRFTLAQGAQRRRFRQEFVQARQDFDRNYRKAKRNYQNQVIHEIENLSDTNHIEFWNKIKQLGPRKKEEIPLETYDEHGNIISHFPYVLEKWKKDFENLYNFQPQQNEFDDDFYNECLNSGDHVAGFTLENLDGCITLEEIQKVVNHSKNNKSVGLDNLPYEIFKNNQSDKILVKLFNKIFDYGLTPSIWNMAIIKPIPKNSLADPRIPLEYRGISLLSTVYKLFTSVLNNRIVGAAESNDIYADKQNGFRKKRSCEDHLFVLTSIIRNRKKERLPTYVAFVDFEKAFDRIDRQLLFYKLKMFGFGGKVLQSVRSIYSDCKAVLNINGHLTDEFQVKAGVRQGDTLSPTLFGLYINDLAKDLDETGKGIKLQEDLRVSSLLYADDLAILAESESDLQNQLDILEKWCKKWRMRVNVKKTKIVHFRIKSQVKSSFSFTFNQEQVECVNRYKYLGIILDENLDFNCTASVLSNSANRALGGICSKFRKLKGLGFNTMTSLFQTGVVPILDYCSGIWGYQQYSQIDAVQNRAIRFYLGLHRFSPNLAINGDVGWLGSRIRRKINMLRLWNRLLNFVDSRLVKKVFMWDVRKRRSVGSWSSDIFKIMLELNLIHSYENLLPVDLGVAKRQLHENYISAWKNEIIDTPKLRTYCLFKELYETEPYVYKVHNRRERSLLSQFRCGILPLKVETGRYTQVPLEYRLCLLCEENCIEDEMHFFFDCSFYYNLRLNFLEYIMDMYPTFPELNRNEKLKMCMSNCLVKHTAKYITDCVNRRQEALYN